MSEIWFLNITVDVLKIFTLSTAVKVFAGLFRLRQMIRHCPLRFKVEKKKIVTLGKEILVDFWLRKSEGNISLDYLDTHGNIILKSSQRITTERLDWLSIGICRGIL